MKQLLILLLFPLFGCGQKKSVLVMSDEHIKVMNPGQQFGFHELAPSDIDSITGYPKIKQFRKTYTLVSRIRKKSIARNASVNIIFNNRHSTYMWQITADSSLAEYYYADTITLKKKTWYYLTTEKCRFNLYFFLIEKGNFIIKQESNANLGAW